MIGSIETTQVVLHDVLFGADDRLSFEVSMLDVSITWMRSADEEEYERFETRGKDRAIELLKQQVELWLTRLANGVHITEDWPIHRVVTNTVMQGPLNEAIESLGLGIVPVKVVVNGIDISGTTHSLTGRM